MNRTNVKNLFLRMIVLLLALFIVACGENNDTEGNKGDGKNNTIDNESRESGESTVLTMFFDAKSAELESNLQLIEDFKKDTGIEVEFNIIPGEGVDMYQKVDISLSAGDTTDILYISNPLLLDKYSKGGWLHPLNDLIAEENYDVEGIFGDYLTPYDDTIFTLPSYAGKWAVYYNKQIFDEAGVEYPSGSWTWDEYIETAKKLTDPDQGIYGSYMLDYDNYMYFTARQFGVDGYNEDGLSNYDDPAFADALQFFSDLGSEHQIQPSWLEQKTKKLAWDGFMSGNYGMHLIGSWYSDMFADTESYPRDWEFGITQIPVPADGKGNNNLVSPAGIGINKHSENPEAAFQFVKYWAENQYKYTGDLPARADLTDNDLDELFEGLVEKLDGEISEDDLRDALYTPGMGVVDEKIVGIAANEYSDIILQESELFLIGEKSLEDTIKAIKSRADQAIENADD